MRGIRLEKLFSDGVLAPPEDSDAPWVFVEIQFRPDDTLYRRLHILIAEDSQAAIQRARRLTRPEYRAQLPEAVDWPELLDFVELAANPMGTARPRPITVAIQPRKPTHIPPKNFFQRPLAIPFRPARLDVQVLNTRQGAMLSTIPTNRPPSRPKTHPAAERVHPFVQNVPSWFGRPRYHPTIQAFPFPPFFFAPASSATK